MWIHAVTHRNLQDLCGCVAIATTSLPGDLDWMPWRSTEMQLEEYFGYLRGQMASAQLTVRDYLHCSARKAFHFQQKQQRKDAAADAPSHGYDKSSRFSAVTNEEFHATAQAALDAALALMSSCTERGKSALLKGYVCFCASVHMSSVPVVEQRVDEDAPDLGMDYEIEDPGDPGEEAPVFKDLHAKGMPDKPENPDKSENIELRDGDAECFQLLAQLRAREVADARPWGEDTGMDDAAASRLGGSAPPPPSLDVECWTEITRTDDALPSSSSDSSSGCNTRNTHHVLTLSTALKQTRVGSINHTTLEQCSDLKGWLWVLVRNLRSQADKALIPNLARARKPAKALNWHQQCEREAALIRQQIGAPAKRCSRAAAWRAIAASLRDACSESDAKEVHELASAMVVLAMAPNSQQWRVGLVLSVWRRTARGSRMTHMSLPMENVSSARVVLMNPVPEKPEGSFAANDHSEAIVLPAFRMPLTLQCEEMLRGSDGLQCRLTAKSLQAVQRAHECTHWPEKLQKGTPARTSAPSAARKNVRSASPPTRNAESAEKKQKPTEASDGKCDQDGPPASEAGNKKIKKLMVQHLHLKAKPAGKDVPVPTLQYKHGVDLCLRFCMQIIDNIDNYSLYSSFV